MGYQLTAGNQLTCIDANSDGVGAFDTIATCTDSSITCPAPTVTGGTNDCNDPSAALAQCTLTCSAGYTLAAGNTLTCLDADNDGVGAFDTTATCTGTFSIYYLYIMQSLYNTCLN